jgi:hypothetical protein
MTTTTMGACTECGVSYEALPYKTRAARLLAHMVNAGELTVGEAKAELAADFGVATFDAEAREILAGWVLARADQGDDWAAGQPVTLTCGCRVSYDATQPERNCGGGPRCELPRAVLDAEDVLDF